MYIEQIPQPLLEDFLRNRVIPFIGAGFSKNAEMSSDITMPDWRELGQMAAQAIPGYVFDGNSIDALSYYEELYSRPKLVEFLMEKTGSGKVFPGKVFESFCNLFTGTICTTNFDSLIEDEMTLLKRPISVIVTEDGLSVVKKDESRIIKVHGDFEHPNKMVITERDYDRYLEEHPIMATYIANLFITNTMLLIGYSLDDNDLRGILQLLNDRLGKMTLPVYCLTINASQEKIERYRRRNIKVINIIDSKLSYKDFFGKLFQEIKEYCDERRKQEIKSNSDKVNAQLIIPSSDNNLCFISCTANRLAMVNSLVEPILKEHNVEHLLLNEVILPGDNWIDKAQTLIDKSRFSIVDLSEYSQFVECEIGMINRGETSKPIIYICDESKKPVYGVVEQVLFYPSDLSENTHPFWEKFENEIITILAEKNRARRLFDKKEYSASIVMAYSEIEELTRNYWKELCMNRGVGEDYMVGIPRSPMLVFHKENILNSDELIEFKKLQELRNKIVHMNIPVGKTVATKNLKVAEKICRKIQGRMSVVVE